MLTHPITAADLARSVIAVPPLARDQQGRFDAEANARLVSYLEQGGIRNLLYGGNAVFYHVALSEYATILETLAQAVGNDTWVIPSVGPAYGMLMDQAAILSETDFPTAMVLPQLDVSTPEGRATGIRHFAERWGKPIVLYLKQEPYLTVELVRQLVDDGLVAAIKYAIVREDPADDDYLSRLVEQVDPSSIVSGIGEQPAIIHLTRFGLAGFTSGCVCVAPRLSQHMLVALKQGDLETAEAIRRTFAPLEDLRNAIHPIRVLHDAVALANITPTGPISPLLSPLDPADADRVGEAAQALRTLESQHAQTS